MNYFKAIAEIAGELDKSKDPQLQKYASVLDEILITISAPKNALALMKAAEDAEIDKLREKYNKSNHVDAGKILQEGIGAKAIADAVKKQVKEYRPLEAPLDTRHCPDHPGVGVIRITDRVVQCSLDHKIYDYNGGFTTMKGNRVPGTSLERQTAGIGESTPGHIVFDTRESMNSRGAERVGLVKSAKADGGLSDTFLDSLLETEADALIKDDVNIDPNKIKITDELAGVADEYDAKLKSLLKKVVKDCAEDEPSAVDADDLWSRDAAKCVYLAVSGDDSDLKSKWSCFTSDECDKAVTMLKKELKSVVTKLDDAITDAVLEAEVTENDEAEGE